MPKRHTAPGPDRKSLLAQTALGLLEKQEWSDITLASVARSAGISLSDVLDVVPSKSELPGVVVRSLAEETVRRHKSDTRSAEKRERLFDVTMIFFDVQEVHAAALKKLYRALQFDLLTLLATRNTVLHLAGELLALAEADTGSSPRTQAAIFAGVLMRAVSAWRNDDQEMGQTMAQLDRDLRRAERFLWPTAKKEGVAKSSGAKNKRRGRNPAKTARRG